MKKREVKARGRGGVEWARGMLAGAAMWAVAGTARGEGPVLPPYRPFIDPIQVHELWWLMVVPLAVGVSVVYKAVRMPTPWGSAYWLGVVKMTVEIIAGMALLAALTYGLVMVYARWVAGG